MSRQLDRPVPATVTAEIDISRMPKAEKESAEQEARTCMYRALIAYTRNWLGRSALNAYRHDVSCNRPQLLMALSHPNIVRCLECFTHQSKLCIVMDWCSEGDLYSICQKRRGMPLPEDTILVSRQTLQTSRRVANGPAGQLRPPLHTIFVCALTCRIGLSRCALA